MASRCLTRGTHEHIQTSPERFVFLASVSLIVIYTVAPFEFVVSARELSDRIGDAMRFELEDRSWRLAGHLAAFTFVGALTARLAKGRTQGMRRVLWLGAIFCLLLEAFQFLQVSRHARIIDLTLNYASWALGASVAGSSTCIQSAAESGSNFLRRHALFTYGSVLLAGSVLWLAAGITPLLRLQTFEWNPAYHLLVGNEEDGTEPWRGDIRYIRLYDAPLSDAQVQRLHSGHAMEKHRTIPAPIIAYDFGSRPLLSSHIVPQGTIDVAPYVMDLPPGAAASPTGNGIDLEGSYLVSRGPANELTKAIVASRTFSIETVLRPLGRQNGPARILSLSREIWWRNFMFGQEDNNLLFRVRDGVNGEDALKHPCVAFNVMDDSLQHLVAVYDQGVSRLYRNGTQVGRTQDLRDPSLMLGLGSSQAGWVANAVMLLMFVTFPACIVMSQVTRTWLRHAIAILLTLSVGCAPYILSPWLAGCPLRSSQLLCVSLVLLTLYPVMLTFVTGRDYPRSGTGVRRPEFSASIV